MIHLALQVAAFLFLAIVAMVAALILFVIIGVIAKAQSSRRSARDEKAPPLKGEAS